MKSWFWLFWAFLLRRFLLFSLSGSYTGDSKMEEFCGLFRDCNRVSSSELLCSDISELLIN